MFDSDDDALHLLQARERVRYQRRDAQRTKKPKDKPLGGNGADTVHGTVVEVNRDGVVVATRDSLIDVAVDGPTIRRILGSPLAVGDSVSVVDRSPALSRLARVHPRRTVLSRGNPRNPNLERVIVANVDQVVVVSAATDPPFRPRLVDRYLVAIQSGGASPVVVVNKADLADADRLAELDALLEPYAAIEVPTVVCSARTGVGLDALRAVVAGQRVAFVGHSGTGKSSLVSALGSSAVAGDLTEHGRGRHTTSASAIHRLSDGTEVVDTPGVRQFAPWRMSIGDLRAAFPDLSGVCAFSSCTHDHELECSVRDAVEDGTIPSSRLDSWLRLLACVD